MNSRTRAGLIGLVGLYLIYQAYELYKGRSDPNTTMTPFMNTLFIVLFAVAAAAVLVYAYRIWRDGEEESKKPPEDDEDSMK